METFTLDFLAYSALLGGLVTPNAMNLLKDFGWRWPTWFKYTVSIVGAGLASWLALGAAEGWSEIELTGDYLWAVVGGMAITYPVQLTAWRNLWKKSAVGIALAAAGQPKDPGE